MRFCSKCGNEVEEGTVFCQNCGNKLEETVSASETAAGTAEQNKRSSNKIVGIVVTAVLAVIAIILIVNLTSSVFSGGYKKPIKLFCEAVEKGDSKKLKKAFPSGVSSLLTDNLDYYLDEVSDVKSVKYKIIEKTKVKKADKEDTLSNSMLYYYLSDSDMDDIGNIYIVKTKITVKGKDDTETNELTFTIGDTNEGWRILNLK